MHAESIVTAVAKLVVVLTLALVLAVVVVSDGKPLNGGNDSESLSQPCPTRWQNAGLLGLGFGRIFRAAKCENRCRPSTAMKTKYLDARIVKSVLLPRWKITRT